MHQHLFTWNKESEIHRAIEKFMESKLNMENMSYIKEDAAYCRTPPCFEKNPVYTTSSINRSRMVATSARVAVCAGAKLPPLRPVMMPVSWQ